jgi:Pyridoxamine 5'-phosphate oxidase
MNGIVPMSPSDAAHRIAASGQTACSLHGVLPEWPAGTVTILSTSGDAPHAIPVSAALRAGPCRVLIALAAGRNSLARLRADPRVALTVLSQGDIALTAHGAARVVDDALADGVVAVEIEVERVQNHGRGTFALEAGVRWRWTDPAAEAQDATVREALERLARG